MRKLLLFTFLFISPLLWRGAGGEAFAQTNMYHHFPDSNAVWNQTSNYISGNVGVTEPHVLFLVGDTIISIYTYKKVLSSGYVYYIIPKTCCDYYNTYKGAIRQDPSQQKIYFIPATSPSEQLLYDFNLKSGDALQSSYINTNSNYVSSIDSILIGTAYRKQYHISVLGSTNSSDSNYVQLIEGIGSTFGLFSPLSPPFEGGCILNCFLENNSVEYTNPNCNCDLTLELFEKENSNKIISISPNPSTGIFNINASEKFNTLFIMFLAGKFYNHQSVNPIHNFGSISLSQRNLFYESNPIAIGTADKIFSRKIILQ